MEVANKIERTAGRGAAGEPSRDTLARWYQLLVLGRKLDVKAANYLKQAKGWSYHAPYAGHDGIQLALGLTFRPKKDFLFPYYRDLLTCLAGGISPEEIILNGLSRSTDVASGGRHMSNHFAKPAIRIQNVSSNTGNHSQHAVGTARAIKKYGGDEISYYSGGESACSEGFFAEAINGASREKLPVIFVIQNNGYGISVPVRDQSANPVVADNFSGFRNLRIVHCDGTDVFDSMRGMREAVAYVTSGAGAAMVHAQCVRIGAHSNSDRQELYRSREEIDNAKGKDPLPRFRSFLLTHGFTESELAEIEERAATEVLDAADRSESAPRPDASTVFDFLMPDAVLPAECRIDLLTNSTTGEGEEATFIQAINLTLKEEFRRNDNTFLWGQDVASKEKGGVFNVTKGLLQEFGHERIFNAPIAEDHIIGTANGFCRYREDIWVVVEGAEFADYFWPGIEQLIECSHEYWRTNGQFVPNIVIRLASGGYIGGGLYHSQNLEGTFTTLPGIRIVSPSFADDATGLLRTAMRTRGVTLYLEPKFLYNYPGARFPRPASDICVPFGKARVRRHGTDLSIITYGTTVHWSLQAAKRLHEEQGLNAEVIDLRSLAPLDTETIFASVSRTGRALVVHEDKVTGGFGGELAARISEACFDRLDAPVMRVGSLDVPVGFAASLEQVTLPSPDKVFDAAVRLANY
jgi:2-oxoisovalerate dehydrogenase E1 component